MKEEFVSAPQSPASSLHQQSKANSSLIAKPQFPSRPCGILAGVVPPPPCWTSLCSVGAAVARSADRSICVWRKESPSMGCAGSSQSKGEEHTKKVKKPKPWKHPQSITMSELRRMREEFWDTAPHYGGQKEIWDALRAAAESNDVNLAQAIVESAGIILANADMTTCYDERGAKYELPKYVLSEPTNLV